ncbi:hypothetical protein DRN84_03660 [Candidatus Geothermarchaeota archaeon]|nr:MAG: hypothetical protein DRN84_03660 [Candidatus Geothermarchaeota archaeon]HEW94326.1 hypothetical protein [Thermoprotei archaeon]
MKYMVLGVGSVGKVIVRDLLTNVKDVEKVIAVDYDFKSLEIFSKELNDPRLEIYRGDITDVDEIADYMRKADVVVNATWYEYNLYAIEAAIKAKRDLADLGGLYWMTKKELEYDEKVKEAGITVLVGVGDDPGTSNVLAGYGAKKMDKVEEIHIRWGSTSVTGEEQSLFGFSISTILDEVSMPAILYINGRFVEAPPLSYPELTYFPDPIGYKKTYAIIHSELATLPYTIPDVKTVTYKDTWDESLFPVVEFLRKSGLVRKDVIEVMGCKVSPQKVLATLIKPEESRNEVGALRVELKGYEGGVYVRRIYFVGPFRYRDDWKAGVTAVSTGYGASIGLQLLAEGYVPRKGVIPPELITEPGLWIKELNRRGVPVKEIKYSEWEYPL